MLNQRNRLYPYRWPLVISTLLLLLLAYANYTGWRLFSVNESKSWNASGPGQHK